MKIVVHIPPGKDVTISEYTEWDKKAPYVLEVDYELGDKWLNLQKSWELARAEILRLLRESITQKERVVDNNLKNLKRCPEGHILDKDNNSYSCYQCGKLWPLSYVDNGFLK